MYSGQINFKLKPNLLSRIDRLVEQSPYGSRSEYIRALILRELERAEQARQTVDRTEGQPQGN